MAFFLRAWLENETAKPGTKSNILHLCTTYKPLITIHNISSSMYSICVQCQVEIAMSFFKLSVLAELLGDAVGTA